MTYTSSSKETKNLSITVYNDGFGVVKEVRGVELQGTEDQVQYLDVAEKIEMDSIIVSGLDIREFNYDYDLVSKTKLLEKYLDHHVWVQNKKSGMKQEFRLLSVASGIVLENTETKEIVLDPEGELILPSLPDELIIKPALIWKVQPSKAKEINVSYLTQGMSWTANYVINLQPEHLSLSGWMNIQNDSGATYENANVKVIAGEVKRIDDRIVDPYVMRDFELQSEMSMDVEEKGFADYHMYTIQNETTLKQNQSKQINFTQIENASYQKYYEYSRWDEDVKIIVAFDNKKENQLGIPLPKGKIKVYQEDTADNNLEFIGEDSIGHTPKDEEVKLHIGNAFDIKCEGTKVASSKSGRFKNERYEYEIRNHKDEPILIKIPHHIHGNWEMRHHSDDYKQETANTIVFWVNVQAIATKTIHFHYRIDEGISVELRKEKGKNDE